jgi:hypothetical protein
MIIHNRTSESGRLHSAASSGTRLRRFEFLQDRAPQEENNDRSAKFRKLSAARGRKSMARLRLHPAVNLRAMARPLVVLIPHHLEKVEAVRRLKSGLHDVRPSFSRLLAIEEETWNDNRLRFRVSALGQIASGTIEVEDDHVRLEVALPWLLALLAEKIQPAIAAQGRLLLEKKEI